MEVRCCKGQYFIGTWDVRSMNQSKLEVVKQMARVKIDILGINELEWTGMDEFNSDDHYIYYCGQESLKRNGVPLSQSPPSVSCHKPFILILQRVHRMKNTATKN